MLRKLFLVIYFLLICNLSFALDHLTVLLDWFPNPDHAPLYIAQQLGYFHQQNLDVTLIAPANPTDPPRLVAAGKADIAVGFQPQLDINRKAGLPLVQFATLIDKPIGCLGVNADSNIYTIKDLKNKTIGYAGDLDKTFLKLFLKKVGLTLADVKLINVHYNLTQALLTHNVDAVLSLARNYEPIQMELLGHPIRIFKFEDHGVPPYEGLILITTQNKQKDPRIAHFKIALQKALKYVHQHPKKSWQQFAKQHPELNNELNRRAWQATVPLFA